MKILHIITTLNRGGAENHLADLAEKQTASGQILIAFLKGNGYWTQHLESKGVTVVHLAMRRYGDPGPAARLRALICYEKPDVVHAHMPPAELYARIALIGIGSADVPLVISKHNDEPFYKGVGEKWVGRWVARRAGCIIAISEAVRNYTRGREFVASASRVETVPYGIDTAPFEVTEDLRVSELRQSWSVAPGDFLIGTVARMVPQKSLDTLLRGFAIYLKGATMPARLAFVGTGPLESDLKALAEKLGITRNVVWAGFREDVPVVMHAFDLFALTSRFEGFGLVLLEAMAAGKPVVASRVSAIPEVVEEGVTGILVPALDPGALAVAFKYFERNETRRCFGEAGKVRAEKSFTSTRMHERTLEIYKACRTEAVSGRDDRKVKFAAGGAP